MRPAYAGSARRRCSASRPSCATGCDPHPRYPVSIPEGGNDGGDPSSDCPHGTFNQPCRRGENVNNRVLSLTFMAVALGAAASFVFAPSARAQSSCDLGFALTHGGVAETDVNGDGLT